MSRYYKKHGIIWLCRHIITNVFNYRKWVIFTVEINKNHETVVVIIPINIRLLTRSEDDINRLTEFWPRDTYGPPFSTPAMIKNKIKELLAAGEECMIAESNGKIVHMNWIGFYNSHVFEPYEEKLGLKQGEALSHSIYCDKEFRGNNLMGAVQTQVINHCVKNNYKKLISYVRPDNTPARKVYIRFGGVITKTLYILRILGFNICFISRKKH